ncbi:hypothetical protein, partial [Aureimonas pseudogalii]|uniref:hypothetical protein n=1 Tax=Aureimonas pseudogalii TaxID=1744844 RepID=UPI0035E46E5C
TRSSINQGTNPRSANAVVDERAYTAGGESPSTRKCDACAFSSARLVFPAVFLLAFGGAASFFPAVFGTILGTEAVALLPRLTGVGSIRSIVHSRRDVAEWRHPLPVRAPGPDVVAIWPHGRPRPAGKRTGRE